MRHLGIATLQRNGFDIRAEGNYLTTETQTGRSQFFRPKVNISKTFKEFIPKLRDWKVGVYGEREKNDRYALTSDTLQNSSFFYDLMRFYVKSSEQGKVQLGTLLLLPYLSSSKVLPPHGDGEGGDLGRERQR